MAQPAVDLASFSVTRHAADPRADGARRTVRISATTVTIERTLDGVRMRVGIPVCAYRDLVIAIQAPAGRATLRLRHDDAELDVVLGEGEPDSVARAANAWSRVLGRAVVVEEACIAQGRSQPRRRRAGPARRSSFARRRRGGVPARMGRSFATEHEIIARD